jgi:hypothetical protein
MNRTFLLLADDYYFYDRVFKKRNFFMKYSKVILLTLIFILSLGYVGPYAEANYKHDSFVLDLNSTTILNHLHTSNSNPVLSEDEKKKRLKIAQEDRINNNYYKWIKAHTKLHNEDAKILANSIIKYSKIYGVHKNVLLALIKVESNFNQYAISPGGAIGLTQIMLQSHKDKVQHIVHSNKYFNPFDIDTNVAMGAKILSEYNGNLQRYNGSFQNYEYSNKVLVAKRMIDKQLSEI